MSDATHLNDDDLQTLMFTNGLFQPGVFLTPATAEAPVFPNVLADAAGLPAGNVSIMFADDGFRSARIYQGDVTIERDFGGLGVSVGYMWSRGRDLTTTRDVCSIALRVSYGRFSYFTAGDLTAHTRDGRLPWMDIETPVVHATGRVEVAAATHHGYFDACGPAFVGVLAAQAYVIPAWHATHPGSAQLERLIGAWPGERPRDVFATEMLPANRQINARWVAQMRSLQGHAIVRVAPDGESYRIFVTDNTTEHGPVTLTCGPYRCR